MNDYVLLTGATGLLGRYLLRDLALADVSVAALVRGSRRANPQQRIESIMRMWEQELGRSLPRPVVLEGNLCDPMMGLDEDDLAWVRDNCDSLLHNAASLAFVSANGRDSEPWRSNVGGMRNALDVCERTGIRDFHHISTAYVCGLRSGTILEDELDVGQEFGNDYERSKIEAEKLVRSAGFLAPPTVYRPAIIVGDSETGFTTTFHGFYALLKLVHTLIKCDASVANQMKDAKERAPTRLTLTGEELKNLVPVNWVSAVITAIYCNREHHGQTFHLTQPQPVTIRLLQDVMEDTIDYRNTVFCGPIPLTNPTVVEQLFYEHSKTYASYWRDEPTFDTSHTRAAVPHLPCPKVDRSLLLMLANWAIENEFRFKDAPIPEFSETRLDVAAAN
ncbi:MAG: SDR family oxidoreductase [Planctomycetaceae bacterium]